MKSKILNIFKSSKCIAVMFYAKFVLFSTFFHMGEIDRLKSY